MLTGLGSRDAQSEAPRSNIHSNFFTDFVFAPDEEIFMDRAGISWPSLEEAGSTHAYYVDVAQSYFTGDEALTRRIQAVPMRVMFGESNDPRVEVKTLSFDEIDHVVHYMKDEMHNRVAVKSPHCWDDQNLTTWKFTNNEFVASVMKHMADQDEPACSNSPMWNFPPSGIGSKPKNPFQYPRIRKVIDGRAHPRC